MNNNYRPCPCPHHDHDHHHDHHHPYCDDHYMPCYDLRDYGPEPYVVNINEAALQNTNFRTALWTGTYLQLTLMSLNPREDIGLEMHPDVDQFIRLEEGHGFVMMGDNPNYMYFQERVSDNDVILIPAGKWHNLINIGCRPLKLYSIYAPPNHPHGTVHRTKEDAEHEHGNHNSYY